MENIEVAMGLIAGAGDSRCYCMEAIEQAKDGDFAAAMDSLEQAGERMAETHDIQTQLIRDEMKGTGQPVSLLMVHAQDHLNLALIMRDIAEEFITIHEKLRNLEEKSC